jgi:hypothetical protein
VHPVTKEYETLKNLADHVSQDPDLQRRMKDDPVKTLKDSAADARPTPLNSDVIIYRWVVVFLGLAVVVSVIGAIILSWRNDGAGKEPPQILTAIGSAAVGALAGLLSPSPGNR